MIPTADHNSSAVLLSFLSEIKTKPNSPLKYSHWFCFWHIVAQLHLDSGDSSIRAYI